MTHLYSDRLASRLLHLLLLCGLSACLSSCTSIKNQIRPNFYFSDTQALAPNLLNNEFSDGKVEPGYLVKPAVCSGDAKKTAFFISMSGGGSRAAYFSARVLHELDRMGATPMTSSVDGIFLSLVAVLPLPCTV